MAPTYSTFANSTDVTTGPSTTIATSGVAGLVAFVLQTGVATDQVTGVTVGATAMTRPTNGFIGVSGGQIGATYAYFLDGPSLPAGTPTVAVAQSSTATKTLVVVAITSGTGSTAVEDCKNLTSTSVTNPAVTLVTGATTECVVLSADFSGDTVTATSPAAGYTQIFEIGTGAQDRICARRTANSTGGSVTGVGYTYNADQAALIGIALREQAAAGGTTYPQHMPYVISTPAVQRAATR